MLFHLLSQPRRISTNASKKCRRYCQHLVGWEGKGTYLFFLQWDFPGLHQRLLYTSLVVFGFYFCIIVLFSPTIQFYPFIHGKSWWQRGVASPWSCVLGWGPLALVLSSLPWYSVHWGVSFIWNSFSNPITTELKGHWMVTRHLGRKKPMLSHYPSPPCKPNHLFWEWKEPTQILPFLINTFCFDCCSLTC